MIATLFGVLPRQIHVYTREGILPAPEKRGQYDLLKCTRAMLAWWADKAQGKTKGAAAASERLNNAKANLAEMEAAEKSGSMIPEGEFDRAMGEVALHVRARMLSMPDRLAARIGDADNDTETIRAILQEGVDEVLAEFHTTEVKDTSGDGVAGKRGGEKVH